MRPGVRTMQRNIQVTHSEHKNEVPRYFIGLAAKRLTPVEADPARSNQHEIQGTRAILDMFGRPAEKMYIPARFIYLADHAEPLTDDGVFTLSDVRRNRPRAPEYHLYYRRNAVTELMAPEDLLIIATAQTGEVLAIVARGGSSSEQQLLWIFDLDDSLLDNPDERGIRRELTTHDRLDSTIRTILDAIGVEVDVEDRGLVDRLMNRFDSTWPTTQEFSAFARTFRRRNAVADPDGTLLTWVEFEYLLFSTFEKRMIEQRLNAGFSGPSGAEEFLQFSLTVQNRRKSRAGSSLENQFEAILERNDIRYSRGALTEARARPDFVFPGAVEYHDPNFPGARLATLAAKRTVKDRWRQILVEAARVPAKHLLTLEAPISDAQLDEMHTHNVRVVIPRALHNRFVPSARRRLLTVENFLDSVR